MSRTLSTNSGSVDSLNVPYGAAAAEGAPDAADRGLVDAAGLGHFARGPVG